MSDNYERPRLQLPVPERAYEEIPDDRPVTKEKVVLDQNSFVVDCTVNYDSTDKFDINQGKNVFPM